MNDLVLEQMPDYAEVADNLHGLELAFEELRRLSGLKAVLEEQGEQQLSRAALKIINIAAGSACSYFNIPNEKIHMSLEALSDQAAYQVSLEGLTDVIRKIWEAIVRTFKYIWEKITYIFRSQKRVVQKEIKKAETNVETVNTEVKEKLEADPEISTREEYITDPKILRAVSYLNRDLTDRTLLTVLDKLKSEQDKVAGLINALEQTTEAVGSEIQYFLTNLQQQGILAETTERMSTLFNRTINDYISKTFIHARVMPAKTLDDNGINSRDVDFEFMRIMEDFINDGMVYFVPYVKNGDGVYKILALSEQPQYHKPTRIKYVPTTSLNAFCESTLILLKKLYELTELHEEKFKHIKEMSDDALKTADRFISKSTVVANEFHLSPEEFEGTLEFIRRGISILITMTNDVNKVYEMYTATVMFYGRLCDLNVQHYKSK